MTLWMRIAFEVKKLLCLARRSTIERNVILLKCKTSDKIYIIRMLLYTWSEFEIQLRQYIHIKYNSISQATINSDNNNAIAVVLAFAL